MKKERIMYIIIGIIILALGSLSYFYNIFMPMTLFFSMILLLLIIKKINNNNIKYALLILMIIMLIFAIMYTINNIF